MSEYLRHFALEKDLVYERKFEEIHRAIMKIKEKINNLDKAKNNPL